MMILIHACKTSVGRDLRSGSGAGRRSLEGEEEVRVGVRNSWDQIRWDDAGRIDEKTERCGLGSVALYVKRSMGLSLQRA
jgi:hypothetical protein